MSGAANRLLTHCHLGSAIGRGLPGAAEVAVVGASHTVEWQSIRWLRGPAKTHRTLWLMGPCQSALRGAGTTAGWIGHAAVSVPVTPTMAAWSSITCRRVAWRRRRRE